MAIILKIDKTFNPKVSDQYGLDMTGTGYYGVIDAIDYNKKHKTCYFVVDIYGTKESRSSNGTIIDIISFTFTHDDFDEIIGSSGIDIPQAYSVALGNLNDWESDE